MGGNLAAFVGATVSFPVATAPLAAAHSPAPAFLDGVLRMSIDWDALGGRTEETASSLREYLGAATILNHPPPEHMRAAVIVAGTRDGFIPTAAVHTIHRHWPGSRLDWVNAGHSSMLWRRKDRLVTGIVDSFDRLDAISGDGRAEDDRDQE
jgi:pimeloyl-ACP methyl ester carboxylesterase